MHLLKVGTRDPKFLSEPMGRTSKAPPVESYTMDSTKPRKPAQVFLGSQVSRGVPVLTGIKIYKGVVTVVLKGRGGVDAYVFDVDLGFLLYSIRLERL